MGTNKDQYALALGRLAMEAGRLEHEVRTLVGMLPGPPYADRLYMTKDRSFKGLTTLARFMSEQEGLPKDVHAAIKEALNAADNAWNERSRLLHGHWVRSLDANQPGGVAEDLTVLYYRRGLSFFETRPLADIDALTEVLRIAADGVSRVAWDRVLPITDPHAATANTTPLSDQDDPLR